MTQSNLSGYHSIRNLLLGWSLIVALLGQTLPAQALPAKDSIATLKKFLQQDQEILADYFQRDNLLDSLDYDAAKIIRFLQDGIAFQPYHGVLRGIDGTLASRAGNAHDQAITLAALLKDAGYDAQIASVQLSPDQARILNDSMGRAEFALPPASVAANGPLRKALRAVQAHQLDTDQISTQAKSVATTLTKALPTAELQAMGEPMLDSIAAASRNYRWVRYRSADGEPWQDIHPAFADAAKWQLEPSAIRSNQVDTSDLQRISIELWIEDSSGKQTLVGNRWTAPVANLHDRPIELGISSNAVLQPKLWDKPDDLFAESRYFFLTIDGATKQEDLIFDLQGKTYPMAALEGLNSVFATVSEKGQRAAAALSELSGGNAEASKVRLQRVWLNLGMSKPGIKAGSIIERSVRRDLFDRAKHHQEKDVARTLLQQWILDTATGDYAPHYYRHKQVSQLAAQLEGYESFMTGIVRREETGNLKPAEIAEGYARLLQDPAYARLPYLRSMFALFHPEPGNVQYVHEPNLLAIRTGFSEHSGTTVRYQMTDIISNGRLAFRQSPQGLTSQPGENIARGVWETRAEIFRLGDPAEQLIEQSAFAQLSTATQFSGATIAGAPTDSLNLIAGESENVWWQIDRNSGSAIGMSRMAPGQGGAEMTEEVLFTVITWGFAGAVFLIGTTNCIGGGGNVSCCVGSNAALTLGAYMTAVCIGLVGVAVGAGWGAGVASSVVLDLGLTQVTVRCGGSS